MKNSSIYGLNIGIKYMDVNIMMVFHRSYGKNVCLLLLFVNFIYRIFKMFELYQVNYA